MRNILLFLRYVGTHYHGWAVQPNAVTVQGVFQQALERVVGHKTEIKGCSRTDAGVHANRYGVSFKTSSTIDCEALVRALNAHLPYDMAVSSAKEVEESFHARYNVVEKEYVYRIHNARVRDPFWHERTLFVPVPLDAAMMDKAAQCFVGMHDFRSFMASGSGIVDTVRTMSHASVARDGEMVTFTVRGDGFLYNMVRIMVGTLLDVGGGKLKAEDVPEIIAARNREAAGVTVSGCGLYLNEVVY